MSQAIIVYIVPHIYPVQTKLIDISRMKIETAKFLPFFDSRNGIMLWQNINK